MTVLDNDRQSREKKFTYKLFPLAVGNKAFKNGLAALDLSTGKCEPGHTESDLFALGKFESTVDATSAETPVNVYLGREVIAEWWENDTGSPVTIAMLCALCYMKDDQTVTSDPTGASVAGRIWDVDSVKGVLVEKVGNVPAAVGSLDSLEAVETVLAAFSSNNINLASNPNSGAIYDVPTTGAASTITLPATAAEGTLLYFTADGTKNGHTVQYRDATGPVNITTALTASKRHTVIAMNLNGLWFANAYVSP